MHRRRLALGRLRPKPEAPSVAEAALAIDGEPADSDPDLDRLPVADLAGKDRLGQGILQVALDHPLERPRSIGWIIALLGQPVLRRRIEPERDVALAQQLFEPLQLD